MSGAMTHEQAGSIRAGDIVTFRDAAGVLHKGVVMFAPNKSEYLEIVIAGNKCLTIRIDRLASIEHLRDRIQDKQDKQDEQDKQA